MLESPLFCSRIPFLAFVLLPLLLMRSNCCVTAPFCPVEFFFSLLTGFSYFYLFIFAALRLAEPSNSSCAMQPLIARKMKAIEILKGALMKRRAAVAATALQQPRERKNGTPTSRQGTTESYHCSVSLFPISPLLVPDAADLCPPGFSPCPPALRAQAAGEREAQRVGRVQ